MNGVLLELMGCHVRYPPPPSHLPYRSLGLGGKTVDSVEVCGSATNKTAKVAQPVGELKKKACRIWQIYRRHFWLVNLEFGLIKQLGRITQRRRWNNVRCCYVDGLGHKHINLFRCVYTQTRRDSVDDDGGCARFNEVDIEIGVGIF
ncbi:hypothetical protein CEXT_451631 [Caerostris extrusa]|uniref:DDE Tnp4 domain-containing protein n=1 Tax=Caerostris extrusa TaxID=172846 RepID=A0AAV4W5A9_CAEEX|nr:hypothetical protein CEXT_451631 [Caerostris extrusa]